MAEVTGVEKLDLGGIADSLDAASHSRALGRILQHHSDVLAECDRLTARLGRCEKSLAEIEARLAAMERKPEAEGEARAEKKKPEEGREERSKNSDYKGFLFHNRKRT